MMRSDATGAYLTKSISAWIAILASLSCWLAASAVAASDELLRAPFDVEAIRAAKGKPIPIEACPEPVPPIRDIEGVSFYSDPQGSKSDPAKLAANEAATRPLDLFLAGVVPAANRWIRGRPAQPEAASCALRLLAAWADASAMLGRVNQQGSYHRKWTLAGAALAYLQIRDTSGLDAASKGRVADWLRAVALAVRPAYDRDPQPGKMSIAANNHAYWAGVAVGAAAIAANDRVLFEWAIERMRVGLRQVTADGALPLELARGRLALHYHLFALEPLAVLEVMAHANGADLAPADDAALRRLVAFTVRALDDSREVARLARAEQQDDWLKGRSALTGAGGVEIWLGRHPDGAIDAKIAPFRPYRLRWLGGDVSLLFGP
jgi:poly(beta-D-mannuronate) lyase